MTKALIWDRGGHMGHSMRMHARRFSHGPWPSYPHKGANFVIALYTAITCFWKPPPFVFSSLHLCYVPPFRRCLATQILISHFYQKKILISHFSRDIEIVTFYK